MARPPHEPDKKTRNLVSLCVIAGIPFAEIAKAIGITRNTLTKHYNEEITTAKSNFIAQAVGVLHHHLKDKNLAAAIFTLKTQARWTERHTEEEIAEELPTLKKKVVIPKRKQKKGG